MIASAIEGRIPIVSRRGISDTFFYIDIMIKYRLDWQLLSHVSENYDRYLEDIFALQNEITSYTHNFSDFCDSTIVFKVLWSIVFLHTISIYYNCPMAYTHCPASGHFNC